MKNSGGQAKAQADEKTEFTRRLPAIITFMTPFRLIESRELELWDASLDDVNNKTWDYVKLHEVAGGIDVGLERPYHLLVGRDGALALPPMPALRSDQKAVEFFNRCLAAMVLGGIYCNAITLDNLEMGSLIDWKYIRTKFSNSANRFHRLIRLQMAPPLEAIKLQDPPTVDFDELSRATRSGFKLLELVPHLSPEFLLKGVSGIARRDWGVALSNLWIVIEQLTESLWDREILQPLKEEKIAIPGRKDNLESTRTWTIASRHEMLHVKRVVTLEVLGDLYVARKARNLLSHEGRHPSEHSAASAYRAALALLQVVVKDVPIPLMKLDLSDHSLSDPFKPDPDMRKGIRKIEPRYWMPMPMLPGEQDLDDEEFRSLRLNLADEQPEGQGESTGESKSG